MYENYLAHYGVKGMKWGVRKAAHISPKNIRSYAKERHALNKQTRKKIRNINSTREDQRQALARKHDNLMAGHMRARWFEGLPGIESRTYKEAVNKLNQKKVSDLTNHDIETGRQIAEVYANHKINVKQLKSSYRQG